MIKEKHDKGPDSVKEEASSSDKDCSSSESCIKKEDDGGGGGCDVKKQPIGRAITKKNGGLIGSTNTGSLHSSNELKCQVDDNAVAGDLTSLPTKVEEGIEGELSRDAFGLGVPSVPPHPPAHDGPQPLQSNVISKQANNMEVQYMQQQSQIFVFSTELANAGAEQVLHGNYHSIIAYHCAQPGTKKYLEKNPLKINQFNRQSSPWLTNLTMIKNKGCTRSPGLIPPKGSLDLFLESDGLDDMVGLSDNDLPWDQKNNHHLDGLDSNSNGLPDVPDLDTSSPSLANMQPSLQGVKVPDENLTPQQRQHREEQLATIRKMHQILFPENQLLDGEFPEIPHNMIPGNLVPGGPTSKTAQIEWQKLQQQFYEERTKIKHGPLGLVCGNRPLPASGPRLQGPPPPYHQTQRSASVPVAMQSPNPGSPNNPTSNLSLPSPRASSALNSPADPNRPFNLNRHMSTGHSPTSQGSPTGSRPNPMSNPGTPVSSHLSPSINSNEPSNCHQSSVDGMFGRTLQSMAQQKQLCSSGQPKEPNLMPVPSPQQIQYLNTFEGQELIIQKQPNTSLKEGNVISPPVLSTSMDSGFPGSTDLPPNRVSGPNTPTSVDMGRYPSTPGLPPDGCRFQIPSPHTPTGPPDKQQRLSGPPSSGLSPQTVPGPSSDSLKGDLFPIRSPHMMDVHRFPGSNTSPGPKLGGGFVMSPSGKPSPMDMSPYGCPRADNVPLNPNCTNAMPGNPKITHFDPISSLAQMSQQLTNSVASSLNGQGAHGGGMMSYGSPSMHMMDMGPCHGLGDLDQGPGNMLMPMQGPPPGFHPNSPMGPIRSLSPKLQGAFPNHMTMPRMMGRPPGPNPYNGANVQVKPNAPNTIQYMPAKSQIGNPSPRGPPSLDFLQRFANPHSNLESKIPTQNLQYFPNCGPSSGPMQGHGGPMPSHMSHLEGPIGPPEGPMGHMMAGHMGNGAGPMMGGGMGMPGPGGMMPMMRGPMRPGMMRVPHMGYNGPPSGGPDVMYNPGPNMNNPNTQMFVTGPKVSPMGLGAPDASQPLPPSMGQSNSFKNTQFVGPTTADPNYAQQFHNFQQQLYATCTRNQLGGQSMGPGPGPPHSQQPPYFNPK